MQRMKHEDGDREKRELTLFFNHLSEFDRMRPALSVSEKWTWQN